MLIGSAFILSSCHGKVALPEFHMPEFFDSDKEYEIVFWAKNENHKEQQEAYRAAVSAFEALYPNISVTLKMYTDYNRIYRDVITNIGTGTTPNVCITYPDHIATYNTGDNVVVALDELISDERFGLGGSELRFDGVDKDEIVSAFLEEGKIGGEQFALPFMRSTEACYINVDLVEKLGYPLPDVLTWDFVFEVSRAAMNYGKHTETDKKGNEVEVYDLNGDTVLIPFIYKSSDNMMIQYLKQAGADYSTEDGDILLYNDTAKELIGKVIDGTEIGAFSTFSVVSYPGNFLNAGQCIFAVDSTAGATWMGADAPHIDVSADALVDFELKVMAAPQLDPEEPQLISQGPSVCVFNKTDPGEVVASWLFAQFLLTNDVQISYAKTEGYIPVTSAALEDAEYVDYLSRRGEEHPTDLYLPAKIDAARVMLDNIDNTFVTAVFNGSASVRNAAGGLIDEAVKAVNRKQDTSPEAIDRIYEKLVAQYHLDQIMPDVGEEDGEGGLTVKNLGPMPAESIILIVTLVVIWAMLGGSVLIVYLKKLRQK